MIQNFYDKIAKKFRQYHTGAKYNKEYPAGDPEEVFKNNLLALACKEKTVLDSGCADGRFTLSIAPHFKKIIAIDLSKGMLNAARKLQKDKEITNVDFEYMDAHRIKYPDKTFDVIYNRRGPTDYSEFHRLLKQEGYYLEIQIGEQDAKDIKVIFGRGQNFGKWNESTLERNKQKAKDEGFKIVFTQDYHYNEYYFSSADLDLFLQGVPIFEDYDPIKDNELLKKYISQFQEKKGIRFPRHRVVMVAKKI